eukprot:GSMAST32.ASY1.ANO1.1192.1 assembled CDS
MSTPMSQMEISSSGKKNITPMKQVNESVTKRDFSSEYSNTDNRTHCDSKDTSNVITVLGTKFDLDGRYELIKSIGHGAYGIVISCVDKQSESNVAVKKIPNPFDDIVSAKRVLREIKLLMHFQHDNLMNIIDIQQPRSKTLQSFKDVYIVAPLMETDLHRIIYSRQPLTNDHTQYFIYQILRGLKYMHSAKVLHRDLKPSNILLNSDCDLKIYETSDLTEYVVTQYASAVDIWSVGCIFAECIGRKPLFPGDDYIHQLQLISDKLGSPTESDMHFIKNEKAQRFMQNLPKREKIPFTQLYPTTNKMALDFKT